MVRRARRVAAVLVAAAAVTLAVALPASAEPNYPPAFTRITADRTIVAPKVAVHFSAQTFTPGTNVTVDVSGTSAQSLSASADANGVAHAAVAFGTVGAQTVTFRGVDLLGSPLSLSTVITVVPAGSPGTGDPGTGGSGSSGPGSTGGPGGTGGSAGSGTIGAGSGGATVGQGFGGSSGGSGTGSGSSGTGSAGSGSSGPGSLDASGTGSGTSTTDATGLGGTLAPVLTATVLAGLLLAAGVALVVAGRRRNRSADPS
jgi:hypothetical protein